LNAGTHKARFFYWYGHSKFEVNKDFIIDSVSQNITFNLATNNICADAISLSMSVNNASPSNGTGVWSGMG